MPTVQIAIFGYRPGDGPGQRDIIEVRHGEAGGWEGACTAESGGNCLGLGDDEQVVVALQLLVVRLVPLPSVVLLLQPAGEEPVPSTAAVAPEQMATHCITKADSNDTLGKGGRTCISG